MALDIINTLILDIDDLLYDSVRKVLQRRRKGHAPVIYKQRGPPSINEVQTICEYLKNPQNAYDTIHVAGTNGKGSTCLKLANIYKHLNDYYPSVGLMISPSFRCFRDRISINGEIISKYDFYCCLSEILKVEKILNIPLVYSELCALMTFYYFSINHVSIAVIETTLGGLYCATNVIQQPLITLITSISMDHTHILGNTIKDITIRKCGIIKSNAPCIIGPNVKYDIVNEYIKHKQSLNNVDLYALTEKDCVNTKTYDDRNTLFVQLTLKVLNKYYPEKCNQGMLDHAKLKEYLRIRPPGRLELHQIYCDKYMDMWKMNERYNKYITDANNDNSNDEILLLLDGAHNENGIKMFFKSVLHEYPRSKYTYSVIFGCKNNKDEQKCLQQIDGNVDFIYFVSSVLDSDSLKPIQSYSKYKFKTAQTVYCDEEREIGDIDIVLIKAITDCYQRQQNKKQIIFCIGTLKTHNEIRRVLEICDDLEHIF